MPELPQPNSTPLLYKGDAVKVRTLDEIIATLDEEGCLESLPFMPEMRAYCGREFTVACRLEKTCVEGYGARTLPDTVILDGLRCDGSGHDGCQRACAVLWKLAWLEPVARSEDDTQVAVKKEKVENPLPYRVIDETGRYLCQSTRLYQATSYLFPLSIKRCTVEYTSRNISLNTALHYLWTPLAVKLKSKILGRAAVQPVGSSRQTPTESLDLQAGDWVEVKTAEEIGATLDGAGFNRGLEFTPQMLPFCGGKYRVRGRVERAILETTGRMKTLRNTVILERATCDGHTILGGCSRDVYHYWREIWLRRTTPPGTEVP